MGCVGGMEHTGEVWVREGYLFMVCWRVVYGRDVSPGYVIAGNCAGRPIPPDPRHLCRMINNGHCIFH